MKSQPERIGAARADLEAAPAVETLPIVDHPFAGHRLEVDYLWLRTDRHAFPAVIAARSIEAHTHQAALPHDRVERPQRTQRSTPSVPQHEQVKEKNATDGQQAESGYEDQLAVHHRDGAHPFECSHPAHGRDRKQQNQHCIARLPDDSKLSADMESTLHPAPQIGDHIDWANPAAERAPPDGEIERGDDSRADQGRGRNGTSRCQDLQDRQRIREGHRAQQPRAAEVPGQNPQMEMRTKPEQPQHTGLCHAAREQVAMRPQPAHGSWIPPRSSMCSSTRSRTSFHSGRSGAASGASTSWLISASSSQPKR